MATYNAILILFLMVSPSLGYYTFRKKIPNGENVPHPCKANYMWAGVGHLVPTGGGERNPFGIDFHKSGYLWTKELCLLDSDGDGMTNGQELGDPNCRWTVGNVPESVTNISHPGVCNPYGKGVCAGRDSFVNCDIKTFGENCDVIKEPDVKRLDLRFKEHTLPATETNYYCQYFELPSTKDYHIVANEGLIDNHDVLHHMILYGCPKDYEGSESDLSPNPCSMSGERRSCSTIISLWSVGSAGTCYGSDVGFKIGASGFKKVKLEIHYNNPLHTSGYTDKTGIRLFYREAKPGVQDLATFTVGQTMLEIPPGKDMVEARGSCPSDCTRSIATKKMSVWATVNHMHYMGSAQKTEIIRNGAVIKVLADDHHYNYDSPQVHKHDTPFELLPGDEIATTCRYSSMSKKRYVYFGEATSDEMCFAFLTVFPQNALSSQWCTSHGPLSTCDFYTKAPKHGCDWSTFTNLYSEEMNELRISLENNCNLDGTCRPECEEAVKNLLVHPCIQNKEMNTIVTQFLGTYTDGVKFLGRLHSCSRHHGNQNVNDSEECRQDCSRCRSEGGNGGDPLASRIIVLVTTATLIFAIILF